MFAKLKTLFKKQPLTPEKRKEIYQRNIEKFVDKMERKVLNASKDGNLVYEHVLGKLPSDAEMMALTRIFRDRGFRVTFKRMYFVDSGVEFDTAMFVSYNEAVPENYFDVARDYNVKKYY
ncbi:hypothetical protein phiOC_p135 [Ochrobactrum phage vB_OspM_OC]|nr:hypothetical protein phiOC_p135 [Ochrobactrum phage vB_OspM_OC]